MPITVTGILKDSLGNVLSQDSIRFTSLDNLTGSAAVYTTDEAGVYNFELDEGKYRIEGNYLGDEYHELGTVVVDEFTPSPITIIELILYGSPVVPPIILEADPDWDQLFTDVKTDGAYQEAASQVRDDESYTSEVKELWRASEAVMTDESLESNTTNAKITTQCRVYEDDNLNHMSALTHEGETSNIRIYTSMEAYEASNGKQEIQATQVLTGSKGEIEDTKNVDDTDLDIVKKVSFETTSVNEVTSANTDTLVQNKYSMVHGSLDQAQTIMSDLDISREDKLNINGTLNLVVHTAEISDKKELAIDINEIATALKKAGIKVYDKEAFQQLTITDGISNQITQVDNYLIQDDNENILAHFDTVNNTLDINGRLNVQNAEDFKGTTGDSVDYIYQYSTDNNTWHDIFDPIAPDRWRRERKRINEIEIGAWSEGIYINAEDGRDGDVYYNQYQYSVDDVSKALDEWHNDYLAGDSWRRWRVVENSIPVTDPQNPFYGPDSGWFIERIKGLDGPAGWVPYLQYQYSVNNLPPWHNDFITGDLYRREKVDWYASSDEFLLKDDPVTPSTPIVIGVWTSGAKIAPEDGVDYGAKYATVMMYKRSNTDLAPTDDPATVTYDFETATVDPLTSNGWTTDIPAGLEDLWVAVATVFSLGSTDTVSEWVVEKQAGSGFKSGIGWLYQRTDLNTTLTDLDLPEEILTFDFSTGKVTTGTPAHLKNWSVTVPSDTSNGTGSKLWVTFNTALTNVSEASDELAVIDWETPAILTQSGVDGDEGSFTSFIFKNAVSQPATPGPGEGSYDGTTETYPATWTDSPTIPASNEFTWISKTKYTFENNSWTKTSWSTPSKHSGETGETGATGQDGYTPVKGVDYFDGIDGQDGSDGDSAYQAWLDEGNTGTTTDFINALRGADGADGSDGIPGADGADGQPTYTWIKYADSSDGVTGFSNIPTDKPYIGFAFNKTTITESSNPADYTWSLIKGADGVNGADGYTPVKGVDYFDGVDGQDGADGDSAYNIWLAEGNSGTTTDFINALRGADGADGSDGIPGIDGVDGTTTYTWIKYADNSDGSVGFSNTPSNKPYIGFAFNKTTATESTDPNDYTWSLIKGADGEDATDFGRFTSFIYQNSVSQPATPLIGEGSFDGVTETIPAGWTDGSTTPTGSDKSWVTTAVYTLDDGTGTWSHTAWKVPTQFTGDDGATGDTGPAGVAGQNGSGWYYYTGAASGDFYSAEVFKWDDAPSQTIALNGFITASGGRSPVNGDILIISTSNNSHIDTGMYNSSLGEFESIAQIVSGNMVIDGTLNATALKANSIGANQVVTSGLITQTAQIGNGLITTALIGNGQITTAKIGSLQVANANIANSAITAAKIGSLQVTNAKIGNGAITNAKIGNLAVNNAKIATAAVDTLEIAGNAVSIMQAAVGTAGLSFTYTVTGSSNMSVFITANSDYDPENAQGTGTTGRSHIEVDGSEKVSSPAGRGGYLATIQTLTPGNHTIAFTYDYAANHGITASVLTAVGTKR